MLDKVSLWISLHPLIFTMIIWPAVTGLATWLFKPRTAEQYAAMPARVGAFLKLLGSLGLDVPKLLEAIKQLIDKEAVPSVKPPPFATKAVKAAGSIPPPPLPPEKEAA
jgi:hypothetical protein